MRRAALILFYVVTAVFLLAWLPALAGWQPARFVFEWPGPASLVVALFVVARRSL